MIEKPATKFTALARAEMANSQCSWTEAWNRTQKKHPELVRKMASGATIQARQMDRFKAIRSEFCNDNVSADLLQSLYTVMPAALLATLQLTHRSTVEDIGMMCRDRAPKLPQEQQKWLFNALVLAIARESNTTNDKALEKAREQFPNLYKAAFESSAENK